MELPKSKGVVAYIKQPTLEDEMNAIKSMSSRPGSTMDIITETLIIERFEQDIEAATEPLVINARLDIIDAYRTLPAKDKREIYEKFNTRRKTYDSIIADNVDIDEIKAIENQVKSLKKTDNKRKK